MSPESITGAAYITAGLLFILSLAGLSRHETAKRGVAYGIAGMALSLGATIVLSFSGAQPGPQLRTGMILLVLAVLIGGAVGLWRARVVEMTGMPELIALLHSFVGLAAVLVGWNGHLEHPVLSGQLETIHRAEVFIGIFIGGVTFTGSIVAFLKLSGRIKSKALVLPGKNVINLGAIALFAVLTVLYVNTTELWMLAAATGLSFALGWHLVASIGGGDMPVVVSMLNSYSGWAAAAAGFLLSNDLLIITGALVGSSGAYLSYIMCKAMNRSFFSVIAGGFGIEAASKSDEDYGEHREISAEQTAQLLSEADSVVITPGYGMAVAQAQYPVAELAGRLAAKVPYDIVFEMDEVNDELAETTVVLVIGANDTVNPAAAEDPGSPIAGMPVLRVWEAKTVVVFKRSMASGYAGVQNPLFFRENSQMLFGDAKERVEDILRTL